MSQAGTIGIFNNTSRIITIKGITAKSKKRYKHALEPRCMNLVPEALWYDTNGFKNNKLVQAHIDCENIMVGTQASRAQKSIRKDLKEQYDEENSAKTQSAIDEALATAAETPVGDSNSSDDDATDELEDDDSDNGVNATNTENDVRKSKRANKRTTKRG